MPKLKKGLDYFDLQTDVSEDKRIKLLRAEFGIKGFGIWVELIRQIYADEGYFIEWNNDTKLLFASDVGEPGGLVDEVVKGSVRRGLFDKSVFDQFNVLTSEHIQNKYFDAIKRRTSDIKVDSRYLVISLNDELIQGNVNIKLLNDNMNEQRREEQSKVKESKEKNLSPTARARKGKNYQPAQLDPPETVDKVKEIGSMRGIPPDACEIYFDLRGVDNFLRMDKNGNWKPILNWHKDLALLYRKGALDKQKPQKNNSNGYGSNRKSKGDHHVEALQNL